MQDNQKQQRKIAYMRSNNICKICGGYLQQYGTPQYAHKISNKIMWQKKYGTWIIDHTKNGEMVCSLACNQSVDVGSSYGNHLEVIADILIYEYMQMWGVSGLGKLADKITEKYKGVNNEQ